MKMEIKKRIKTYRIISTKQGKKYSTNEEVYNNECLLQNLGRFQINNLMMHLKDLEKQKQIKPKKSE